MQKSPEAFRTISEVADSLDIPQHVLRFWEGKFSQIKPLKRAGGRRYYRPEDVDLLRGIRVLLYGEGYTIKGVQKVLRDSGGRYVSDIGRQGLKRATREAGPALNIFAIAPDDTDATVNSPYDATVHDAIGDDLYADTAAEQDEPVGARHLSLVPDDSDQAGLLARRRAQLEAALQELLALRILMSRHKFKVDAAE